MSTQPDETSQSHDHTQSQPENTPLPSFGDLLGQAIGLYRAKWRTVLLFAGVEFLLYLVVLFDETYHSSTTPIATTLSTPPSILSVVVSVLGIASVLIAAWFQIMVLEAVRQETVDSLSATMRRAARLYLPFALFYLECWLVPLGYFVLQAVVPALAVGALVYGVSFLAGGLVSVELAILAAQLFAIIFGIIVSIRILAYFVMAPWELLEGNHCGVRAFMASRAHVRGHFWEVLGLVLLAIIVGAIAYGIVWLIPFFILLPLAPAQPTTATVFTGVLACFEILVLIPIGFAFAFKLYGALCDRNPEVSQQVQAHSPWRFRWISVLGLAGAIALVLSPAYASQLQAGLTSTLPTSSPPFESAQGRGMALMSEMHSVSAQALADYTKTSAYSSSTVPTEKPFSSTADITSNFPTSFLATDLTAQRAVLQALQGSTGYAAFSQQAFAITVPITTQSTPVWYCIDSSGVATATPTSRFTISGSNVACP